MKQNTLWKQLKIEDSGLSIKEVSEALQNKAKKGGFLRILLGTLGTRKYVS